MQLTEAGAKARIYRFMYRNDLNVSETYGIRMDCIANFNKMDNLHWRPVTPSCTGREGCVCVRKPDSSGHCTVMLGCTVSSVKKAI
eukprot:scaffold1640_cov161-Amphora_coffeaeformis.AAC.38